MTFADLIAALESIAPLHAAEAWDNVGLLVGPAAGAPADAALTGPTLLTIDLTPAVAAEAIERKCACAVAYHPPIFRPISRLDGSGARSRALLDAIRAGMAIYSPHTALDAAPGGVTDWLCDMLAPAQGASEAAREPHNFGDRRALTHVPEPESQNARKIVTFAPSDAADQLRQALASIGAGRIGAYELCSFNIRGMGTFRGGQGAQPAVGEAGRFETVEEIRLEMVCPERALPLAVEMIRQFHPYEEPPIDIYPLTPRPSRSVGAGRRITLDQPASVDELASRLKRNLGVSVIKIAAASDEPIERVGVCPGSGADLIDAAIAEDCSCFVTGEMQHHAALAAVERGCSVILAGHTNSERGYLPTYAQRINALTPDADAFVSERDAPLFQAL